MFKVVTFLGNQISLIEDTLNSLQGEIVASWTTETRMTLIIRLPDEPKKRGRPSAKDNPEE